MPKQRPHADLSELLAALPPIVARERVYELTGGLVSAGYLANLDSQGEGPGGRIRVGRKVCYRAADLVAWLESRSVALTG